MTRLRALLSLGVVGACAIDLAPLPVARIHPTPTAIPEGDAWATEVTLDGRASRDEFGAPAQALTYAWTLDPTAHVTRSDAENAVIYVRFAGDHPPLVRLTVTTLDGRGAETSARLALTAR